MRPWHIQYRVKCPICYDYYNKTLIIKPCCLNTSGWVYFGKPWIQCNIIQWWKVVNIKIDETSCLWRVNKPLGLTDRHSIAVRWLLAHRQQGNRTAQQTGSQNIHLVDNFEVTWKPYISLVTHKKSCLVHFFGPIFILRSFVCQHSKNAEYKMQISYHSNFVLDL